MGREELPAVTRRAIVVDFSRSAHKRLSLRALPKFTPYRVKMKGLPFKISYNFFLFASCGVFLAPSGFYKCVGTLRRFV